MSKLVEVEIREGVATLTLTAPPANTYSYEMMLELDRAILDCRMDESVHVVLVTGSGEKFFCAGAEIAMLERSRPSFKYAFCLHANETLNRLEQTPKLVIAAINGHAVGGGLEVALACDLRIAKQGAGKLGLPEINLGVLPGTGGTQRLGRILGRAKAIELMVRAQTFDVEEARRLELVNEILPAEGFRAAAFEYARQFVPPNRASRAVGFIKRAVVSGLEAGFSEGLALERELQQRLFEGEDAREGLRAYAEKRKPEFTGR